MEIREDLKHAEVGSAHNDETKSTAQDDFEPGVNAFENFSAVSGSAHSLASFQTASTELYVPPTGVKDGSKDDGCVSNFTSKIQVAAQPSSSDKNMENGTREKGSCPKISENPERPKKSRKRNRSELADTDVEATIGMIVSAAEAVVLGQLMDVPSSSSQNPARFTVVEAALSLGKARHMCGLDRYDLSTGAMQSEEVVWQDLDDHSMQQAYADVGMTVEVNGNERQILDKCAEVHMFQENVQTFAGTLSKRSISLGKGDGHQTEGEASVKRCKELPNDVRSAETGRTFVEDTGSEGASHLKNTNAVQDGERAESDTQDLSSRDEEAQGSQQNAQLPPGALSRIGCTDEKGNSPKLDVEDTTEEVPREPSQDWKSSTTISSNSEVGIEDSVAVNEEFVGVQLIQEGRALQESTTAEKERRLVDIGSEELHHFLKGSEVSTGVICTTSCPLEKHVSLKLDGEISSRVVGKAMQRCKTSEVVPHKPQDKFECDIADPKERGVPPERDMVVNVLASLGDKAAGFEQKERHVEGVLQLVGEEEHKDAVASKRSSTFKAMQQGAVARDMLPEIGLPSEAMAFSEETSYRSVGKIIDKEFLAENAATKSCTPYVSRWFGGWTGNVRLTDFVLAQMQLSSSTGETIPCCSFSRIP